MNFRNGIGAHLDDQANTTLGRHWGSILSILDRTDGTVDRVTLTGEHERVDDEGDEEEVGLGEEDTEYAGVGRVDLSSGNGGMSTRRSTRGSPKEKKAPVATKKAEGSKGKGREDPKADHTAKKVFDPSKHVRWPSAVSFSSLFLHSDLS
jgi:hypothetical protein